MKAVSIKEVIADYEVSYSTIRRLISTGKLKTRKGKGNRVRIDMSEIQRLGIKRKAGRSESTSQGEKPQERALESVLKVLQEQLQEKDKQIGKLSELIHNQQIITRDLQNRIFLLEAPQVVEGTKQESKKQAEKHRTKSQKREKPGEKPRDAKKQAVKGGRDKKAKFINKKRKFLWWSI